MASITVLVDHIAIIRDSMQTASPDPVSAAIVAELAGVDGVGVYLREDRQYIQERDLNLLRQTIQSRLILYMAPVSEMVGIALDIKPERVVLVPPQGEDGPLDNGLDLIVQNKNIYDTMDSLQSNGITVGVSIEADPEQVKLAHQYRATWIQIHAGRLRAATSPEAQSRELDHIIDTIKMAHKLRLRIAIGGGLDYRLIRLFGNLQEIDEFSIGQSLVARAILKGIPPAVDEMIGLIREL